EINDFLKLFWARTARAFCPSCSREIRPETAKSIADQVFAHFELRPSGGRGGSPNRPRAIEANPPYQISPGNAGTQTILITFWVAVPAKTRPRDFFQFLQQQGYLRVWLNGEIVRVDSGYKVERLCALVQV